MKQRPEIDRLLEVWMADGPTAIPDRVVDVVATRIGVERQRRAWPFARRTNVTTPIKLVAALAAAIVVAVVGYSLLPGQISPGAPTLQPTSSPGQTTVPPGETIALGPAELRSGPLSAGSYLENPFDDQPSFQVVADYPEGWIGLPPIGVTGPDGTAGPAGIGIAFLRADGLFSDPCHWNVNGSGLLDQPGDIEVGPEVIDLVEAIRANPAYTVPDPPAQVSFGPDVQGYELEIQLPADLELETCDLEAGSEDHRYVVFSGQYGSLYAQGDGNRWHLFVVDVRGIRVIVNILYFDATPVAEQQAAQAVIESLDFGP